MKNKKKSFFNDRDGTISLKAKIIAALIFMLVWPGSSLLFAFFNYAMGK